MKRLLLIVLIFLIMGAVSAHDDLNDTADSLLNDEEYNFDIDYDEILEVEENGYIPVDVSVDEPWSLNVYIDGYNSTVNDEFVDMAHNQIDIPTSVMIDEEVPLALGNHSIIYEFKFTNTTSLYLPDAYVSDSGVYFYFDPISTGNDPQDVVYRFNSQFNIIESIEPISATFDLGDIDVTYSDSFSFNLKGISSGKVTMYLNDTLFDSFEFYESPYEDEIDTTKLEIGSYNLVCIVESDNVYAQYNVKADNSNSAINIKYVRSKITNSPNRYITIINTTLNVRDFPKLNPIYVNAPAIDINYARSIPVRFEGDGAVDVAVYVDGEKVYNNSVLLSWENVCYIPAVDADGNYLSEGIHNISFEFVFPDKYSKFTPEVSWYSDALTFDFFYSKDSKVFLNDKYIVNTKLNIINTNPQFISIDSQAALSILHADDINLKIDGLPDYYNLTVFVDDVEIYDDYTDNKTINIKTFFARSSIMEANERDIQSGSHAIRFEFKDLYKYDVDVAFRNNVLYFNFDRIDSSIKPNGVYYQFNTSLIVNENEKTVHIRNVKNNTYFEDTEFVVVMDVYEPEDFDWGDWDDWDDLDYWDDEDFDNPIGTQDVGIIISNEDGIVYIGDDLMNVYEELEWNYEFVNENLPKAGVYTIKIINLADNTYDTASFEVKKENRIFNKKYSSDDFNVLFTLDFSPCRQDLNGLCYITLDNQEKVVKVRNGLVKSKTEVLFEDVDPGIYTATFTLKGNGIYNDVTLKSKVTVKKEAPTITYQSSDNRLDLTIDISQSKTGAVLIVEAGGEQKQFTLNSNTKDLTVEFPSLNIGSYDVKIDFKGNERYTSKTLTAPLEITSYSPPVVEEPVEETPSGDGLGNNTGGIGTGSGDSNVTGSGNSNVTESGVSNVTNSEDVSNATYSGNDISNEQVSVNGKESGGDVGSQGSGHGDGSKSYEITKTIIKTDDNANAILIFSVMMLAILFLGFIYERRSKDDSGEY